MYVVGILYLIIGLLLQSSQTMSSNNARSITWYFIYAIIHI